MTMNGMLGSDALVESTPESGRKSTEIPWMQPDQHRPARTSSGRLVRRPTTAAANDATSRNVNCTSESPRTGVRSTPAKPASAVPTIQDPAVTPTC